MGFARVLTCLMLVASAACTTQPAATLSAEQFSRRGAAAGAAGVTTQPGSAESRAELVRQVEFRRTTFRTNQEAVLGNIDRAPPLRARLTDVNVVEADKVINDQAGRNRIIGWLVQASNERCEIYKELLAETDRETNLFFGAISTITGGLAAIFTPAATARALGGAAGISSGLRGDFNSTFFYQQTIPLITKTIDEQRAGKLRVIEAGFTRNFDDWPLSAAAAQVQDYHDDCSLVRAFQAIQAALSRPAAENFEAVARRDARERLTLDFLGNCAPLRNGYDQTRCNGIQKAIKDLEKPIGG